MEYLCNLIFLTTTTITVKTTNDNNLIFFYFLLTGRWCRREWSSPADARNADATRRLYSSVFLGSPGKFQHFFLVFLFV